MKALDLREVVASNLRAARARRGIRQADLAAIVAMPRSTIAAVEGGRRRLHVEEAIALCDALRIGLVDLFEDGVEASDYRKALTPEFLIEDPKTGDVTKVAVMGRRGSGKTMSFMLLADPHQPPPWWSSSSEE